MIGANGSKPMKNICPNCGAHDNETDARFCMACGCKLGSSLVFPPAPPKPRVIPDTVSGRFVINALLWTAPTYNAYSVGLIDGRLGSHTVLEQPLTLGDPFERVLQIAGKSEVAGANGTSTASGYRSLKPHLPDPASLHVMSSLSERLGLLKPIDYGVEAECAYIVFDQIQGLPIAHLDQMGEKEARSVGIQLCEIAEKFHSLGWVHNGFEPYNVVLDHTNKVRLLGFDRARAKGSRTDGMPIYPSRGSTAPELFDEDALYDPRADVYSIAALLQFLLTGERLDSGDGATIYPVATVVPGFERLLARALADDPAARFQTVAELKRALSDLTLPVVLQSGHFTDVGLVRELNEDSILSLNLTQYYESVQTQIGLYIVSDGMGGEAAGEVASRVTVRAIAEWVTEKLISASLRSTRREKIAAPTQTGGLRLAIADGNDMATTELLRMAIMHANREVLAYANANPSERGLGATVTVAMLVGDVLTVAHVGDSRCYLLAGDQLEQLTEDHSLVQRMVNTGNLSRSEARIHPYRNVIYRSIGGDEQIEIDIVRKRLTNGDVILVCSDGLNSMLSDDQIRDILMVNTDPNTAAKELVVNANAAGGEDNTSVVVVRFN
jgi:protein phosphatase